jgi:AcrR family transcriptional regulator
VTGSQAGVGGAGDPTPKAGPRDRLLAAAAGLYARHGALGATTRQIAIAAGVNEVTIFRLFGSKEALLDAAIDPGSAAEPVAALPAAPQDPVRELATWCDGELARLGRVRSLLQQCFADTAGHPHRARRAGTMVAESAAELRRYVERLHQLGRVAAGADRDVAVAMLLSLLLADAVGHDELEGTLPARGPESGARYARTFLSAMGHPGPPRP